MQFELLTLSGVKYSGEAAELLLKTPSGSLAILPHHEPMVAVVMPGSVAVHVPGKKADDVYAVFGGVLEVANNRVRLLADEAEHVDTLIESEIEEALERAKHAKENLRDKSGLHRAQQLIDRHAVRLEVARIRRRYRSRG